MTDPTTGAGHALAITHPDLVERVLFIEAEARAECADFLSSSERRCYDEGRAAALREAAEQVRALPVVAGWYSHERAVREKDVLGILWTEADIPVPTLEPWEAEASE